MTTYRIPDEPNVDRLWIDHPEHGTVEVRRDTITRTGWFLHGIDATSVRHWSDLLAEFGEVSHPDLAALDERPTPWAADGQIVVDGTGGEVGRVFGDGDLARLVVRAVNEYVEQRRPSRGTCEGGC